MPIFPVLKIFILTTASFLIAVSWTPLLLRILHKYRLGKQIRDAESAPVFASLHGKKAGTPTMGGVLVWVTATALALFLFYGEVLLGGRFFTSFSFFSREETVLPIGVLVASAVVGLVDDYYNVRRIGPKGGGLRMRHRLLLYTGIAAIGALWFYFKLDWDVLHIPFVGNVEIGPWYILAFIFVIVATAFSVNETDGLDGLVGGPLLACFAAYGAIAFIQGKTNLAALCGVIVGALLAFLWFNVNPAKFFMGDTGAMSLGVTLGVVAMLTNDALLLPIIGIVFVIESLSVIVQVASKKLRKKKVFLSAPIHHHFEAIGWTEPQIVMRFWIISAVSAVVGFVLSVIDKGVISG